MYLDAQNEFFKSFIPTSLKPNFVDFWLFKLFILLDQKVRVWIIKGLLDQVAKKILICGKNSIHLF